MADVHDKKTRSYNMSQIKAKDTKPELIVRKFLFSNGFRYRLHDKKLPGKPDIVLPKYRTVIFINGCFWHGHENCRFFVTPKTNTEWWLNKINTNKVKDKQSLFQLRKDKWKCINLFECQLKSGKRDKTLLNLLSKLS
jgi:DNA mismatch endonuclease (patch repair protein)